MNEFDSIAELRRERVARRKAVRRFVTACQSNSVEEFFGAADELNSCVDAWRFAMKGVAKLSKVSPEIQSAFLTVWIESKMIALKVGDRRALSLALQILVPKRSNRNGLQIYRGCSARERRAGAYGFSWTASIDVARNFAKQRRDWNGGSVVIQTFARSAAIIHIREYQGDEYYDEQEVIVYPYQLDRVTVLERIAST